jgi:hypothetical protein
MNTTTGHILGILKDRPNNRGVDMSKTVLLRQEEKWNSLPNIDLAVDQVNNIITAEERSTVSIKASELNMDDSGVLRIDGGARFNTNGFKKFLTTISSNGASFLLKQDPDVRAFAVNRILSKREAEIKVHTRNDHRGGREIFSVTGPNFPEGSSADILTGMSEAAPKGTKGVWDYNPNKATVQFEALLKTFDKEGYKIGDAHQAGIKWLLRDAGFGSILPMFVTYRHKCANMAMLQGDNFKLPRTVHRGSMDSINGRLKESFSAAQGMMEQFHAYWNLADGNAKLPGVGYATRYMKGVMGASTRASGSSQYATTDHLWEYLDGMYGDLIKKYPDLSFSTRRKSIDALSTGFREEPTFNWLGLVNGITAAARSADTDTKLALEGVAGNILQDLRAA